MTNLDEICHSFKEYLSKYSWIFDYSNVKIMQEKQKWPSEWYDFIHQTSVTNLKQIFKNEDTNCPSFVRDFVTKRDDLVKNFESLFITTVQDFENRNSENKTDYKRKWNQLKRGMSMKKQHEVLRHCDEII